VDRATLLGNREFDDVFLGARDELGASCLR
jgi:hypothetical protein